MNRKRTIFFGALAVILFTVSFIVFLTPRQETDAPWTWTQSLRLSPELDGIAWRGDVSYREMPLTDEELSRLVVFLNTLNKAQFTWNQALAGITPEYGIILTAGTEKVSVSQAGAPKGALEMTFRGKQWWIDSDGLDDYVRQLSGWDG